MKKEKFKAILAKILKNDRRIWTEEDELDQTQLLNLLDKYDENILKIFLNDENIKKKFFIKIGESYVFKYSEFKFYIEEHSPLANSYSEYINRIGLAGGKRYLKDSDDIVLNFPFKDCILEGGQSSDEGMESYFEFYEGVDGEKTPELIGKNEQVVVSERKGRIKTVTGYEIKQSKRKEVFYNEILAKDEIDRLLDKKALTNWKRYTKEGIKEVEEIKKDTEGTIRENLIIKGNNLLALHSLKENFSGKVKLIYIDPPYNTGSDSFAYNDRFNHSTWLIFMKNRLEVARELLRDDGLILVQCDDNEQEYLKVLLNEIFGKENYLSTLYTQVRYADKSLATAMIFHKLIEHTFAFSKTNLFRIYQEQAEYSLDKYVYEVVEKKPSSKIVKLGEKKVEIFDKDSYEIIKHEKSSEQFFKEIWASGKILDSSSTGRFYRDYLEGRVKNDGLGVIYKVSGIGSLGFRYITGPKKEGATKGKYYQEVPKEKISKEYEGDKKAIPNYYDLAGNFGNCRHEGGVEFRSGKKPEELLQKLIKMATTENDIILDYHLGSGTTAAVAHKMNRQYIGIEQMNYDENDSVIRLKNVLCGDSTGISKEVNWQGGGEFIYCELAKWNENAKEMIVECDSVNKLISLFDELYDKYFLNYNLKIKEFKEKIIREDNFLKLDLDDQKKMFITMLDLNQMYINKDDMDDTKFQLSKNDREITKKFYE